MNKRTTIHFNPGRFIVDETEKTAFKEEILRDMKELFQPRETPKPDLPANPQPSAVDKASEMAKTVRGMIEKEGEFTNHLLTWFVLLQGLLFTALGPLWDKGHMLGGIVPALGLFIAVLQWMTLEWSLKAVGNLVTFWNRYRETHKDYDGPDVIGHNAGKTRFWVFRGLPIAFIVAWLFIGGYWRLSPHPSPPAPSVAPTTQPDIVLPTTR